MYNGHVKPQSERLGQERTCGFMLAAQAGAQEVGIDM